MTVEEIEDDLSEDMGCNPCPRMVVDNYSLLMVLEENARLRAKVTELQKAGTELLLRPREEIQRNEEETDFR